MNVARFIIIHKHLGINKVKIGSFFSRGDALKFIHNHRRFIMIDVSGAHIGHAGVLDDTLLINEFRNNTEFMIYYCTRTKDGYDIHNI